MPYARLQTVSVSYVSSPLAGLAKISNGESESSLFPKSDHQGSSFLPEVLGSLDFPEKAAFIRTLLLPGRPMGCCEHRICLHGGRPSLFTRLIDYSQRSGLRLRQADLRTACVSGSVKQLPCNTVRPSLVGEMSQTGLMTHGKSHGVPAS